LIGDQTAADYERVGELKKKLELEYVELNPGKSDYSTVIKNVKHANR
jgi:hypothetical protein